MSNSNSNSAILARHECNEPVEAICLQAEKELAAFYGAVLELHGADQAARAADDWLFQLESSKKSTPWRRISLEAADKLAVRLLKEGRFMPRQGNVRLLCERMDQMMHAMCPCAAK